MILFGKNVLSVIVNWILLGIISIETETDSLKKTGIFFQ